MRRIVRASESRGDMERWVKRVSEELKALPDDWSLMRNLRIEERTGLIEGETDGCGRI